jgi:hypothetical protein
MLYNNIGGQLYLPTEPSPYVAPKTPNHFQAPPPGAQPASPPQEELPALPRQNGARGGPVPPAQGGGNQPNVSPLRFVPAQDVNHGPPLLPPPRKTSEFRWKTPASLDDDKVEPTSATIQRLPSVDWAVGPMPRHYEPNSIQQLRFEGEAVQRPTTAEPIPKTG